MAQWAKAVATTPEDLSLICRTHMVKGQDQLTQIGLFNTDLHNHT